MVKVDVPVAAIMADPNLSITSSPFAPGKMIIKRASFKAGEIPAHLAKYLITKDLCRGDGTVIYKGKPIPKVAACIAEKKGK